MSTTVTEQPAPAAPAAPVVATPLQSSQSAFVQHLATFPAVSAVAGLVASFPVVKIFVSNAVPLLHAVHERTRPVVDPLAAAAEPALKRADEFGDKVLTGLDSRFPALKTVQPADLLEGAQSRISSIRAQATSAVDARIVKPVSDAASAAKQQYVKVYDSQGKLLATTLNTRIAPLNDRIEGIIVDYLPSENAGAAAALPSKDGSQVGRSISLVKTAAARATPLATSLQVSTRDHIKAVHASKLEAQGVDQKSASITANVYAAAATGRQLAQESAAKVYSVIVPRFQNLASRADTSIAKAQRAADNAAEQLKSDAGKVAA